MLWLPQGVRKERAHRGDYQKKVWQLLAVTISAWIPDAEYPYNMADIRTIHAFDPGFIPLFQRKVYRSPNGGIHRFPAFGIGRFDKFASGHPGVVGCLMPTTGHFQRPNVVDGPWLRFSRQGMLDAVANELIYGVPAPSRYRMLIKNNLPGPFIPWHKLQIVQMARENWLEDVKEKHRIAHQDENEREREKRVNREHQIDEAEYRDKGEDKYRNRLTDKLGVDDYNEQIGRQTGQWREDPKPFLDVNLKGDAA